jgi:hypothetical protein
MAHLQQNCACCVSFMHAAHPAWPFQMAPSIAPAAAYRWWLRVTGAVYLPLGHKPHDRRDCGFVLVARTAAGQGEHHLINTELDVISARCTGALALTRSSIFCSRMVAASLLVSTGCIALCSQCLQSLARIPCSSQCLPSLARIPCSSQLPGMLAKIIVTKAASTYTDVVLKARKHVM